MLNKNFENKEENSKTGELKFPEGVEFRMGVDGLYEIDAFSAPRGSFSPEYDPLANRGFERHEIEAYLNKQQKPPTPMPTPAPAPMVPTPVTPTPAPVVQEAPPQKKAEATLLTGYREKNVGLFDVQTANEAMSEGLATPNPTHLFNVLWDEGEVCCLFADSNLGKSILAVQIGEDIARRGYRVLYFDFELSTKQFQLRYTSPEGAFYHFSENFFRASINNDKLEKQTSDQFLACIEKTALYHKADVVIVDNLTWLCAESEKGADAAKFMMQLVKIKKQHHLSMLIVAHSPKRHKIHAITSNDLEGSKKIYNFFDSVFAIGQSVTDHTIRYIKQIKCRNDRIMYGPEKVMLHTIVKHLTGFLGFSQQGFAPEYELLKMPSAANDDHELMEEALRLKQEGMSYRKIAEELDVSLPKVQRLLKKAEE